MNGSTLELYKVELQAQKEEIENSNTILSETLDIYTSLYDYAAVPLLSFDSHGRITEINHRGAMFLGEARDRLIGKPLRIYLCGSDALDSHLRALQNRPQKHVSRIDFKSIGGTSAAALLLTMVDPSAEDDSLQFFYKSAIIDLSDVSKHIQDEKRNKVSETDSAERTD